MAYQGRFSSEQAPKPRGGAWKIVLIIALVLVLLLALLAGAAVLYVNSKMGKLNQAKFEEKDVSGQDLSSLIGNLDDPNPTYSATLNTQATEATEATTQPEDEPDYGQTGKIINILVVGQDSREGEESKLADGIMLLTLNKETRTLTTTSFLRDSYVKLPEYYRGHTCGWNRINASYALGYSWYGDAGAMEMLNLTLENNFGVKVDGNLELNFYAVVDLINAMGGVDIELEGEELAKMLEYQDMFNEHYEYLNIDQHVELHEGVNTLNGDMALAYARERHINNADSDIKRTARQRKLIAAILDKITKMSPLELDKMINMALGYFITNISPDDMWTYVREVTPYLFDLTLVSNQCPAEGTYWGEMVELPGGIQGGVLKIDFEANKRILQAVINGEEVEGTAIQ